MMFSIFILVAILQSASSVSMRNGGYDDIIVGIDNKLKQPRNCTDFLHEIEESFREASSILYAASGSRASFRKIIIVLPSGWNCTEKSVTINGGLIPRQFSITEHGRSTVQQPRQCGQPGEEALLPVKMLAKTNNQENLAELIVREWAELRYGIFDQSGPTNCNDETVKELLDACDITIRNCSLLPLLTRIGFQTCSKDLSSKHERLCPNRSPQELIFSHPDFRSSMPTALSDISFHYVTPSQVRMVLALDASSEMSQKEKWKFLKVATRRFVLQDIPKNTDLGVVTFSSTVHPITVSMIRLSNLTVRGSIVAKIPDYPHRTSGVCLECVVRETIKLLEKDGGSAAGNIMVLVTGGTNNINDINIATSLAKQKKLKISLIAYTRKFQYQEFISHETGGSLFAVPASGSPELSTLISLGDALLSVLQLHFDRSVGAEEVPELVHKAEYPDTSSDSNIVNGTFFLDPALGRESLFALYFTSRDNPNIKNLWLTSPDGHKFEGRTEDSMSSFYFSTVNSIETPGLWKYAFEREPQLTQSHFVKVTSRVKTSKGQAVSARLLPFSDKPNLNATAEPVIFYAHVTTGDMPVVDARVVVNVRYNGNLSIVVALFDNGSGDPDIEVGDGIYSRYFVPPLSGPMSFSITINADHNDGRAYSIRPTLESPAKQQQTGSPTCGGQHPFIPVDQRNYLSPFQRIMPSPTLILTDAPSTSSDVTPPNRIADLSAFVDETEERVEMCWTSAGDDYDHGTATAYELRYTNRLEDLYDQSIFETLPVIRVPLIPEPAGTPSNFSFEFSLYDTTYYFGLSVLDESQNSAALSNLVEIYIPSPPTTQSIQPITPRQGPVAAPPLQKLGLAAIAGIAAGGCVALLLMLTVACCVIAKNKKANSNYNRNKNLNQVSVYTEEVKKPGLQPEKLLVSSPTPERPPQPVHWTATQLLQEHERRNSYLSELRQVNHDSHYQPSPATGRYMPYLQQNEQVQCTVPSERFDGGSSSPNSYNSNHSERQMLPPPYDISGELHGSKIPPPTLPKPVTRTMHFANPSLQGSFASLASDRKRRNITQV